MYKYEDSPTKFIMSAYYVLGTFLGIGNSKVIETKSFP